MSLISKILATSVVGAGAFAGWTYVKNLKKAQAELEVVPKATIYQLSWDGLTISLEVLLKNPTKGSFSIKFPFVKLRGGGAGGGGAGAGGGGGGGPADG